MTDLFCPYCEHEQDYYEDPLDDDETTEIECDNCKKNFIITAHYSVDYSSEKADCLNGAEHDYQEITGYPKEYFADKRRCSMCGKTITIEVKKNEI